MNFKCVRGTIDLFFNGTQSKIYPVIVNPSMNNNLSHVKGNKTDYPTTYTLLKSTHHWDTLKLLYNFGIDLSHCGVVVILTYTLKKS